MTNDTDLTLAAMSYVKNPKLVSSPHFNSASIAKDIKGNSTQVKVLAKAVEQGYVSASDLNAVAKSLGDDELATIIKNAYSSPDKANVSDDSTNQVVKEMKDLANATDPKMKESMDALLPKLMGAVAKEAKPAKARATLKVVFNALDGNVPKSDPPVLPTKDGATVTTHEAPSLPVKDASQGVDAQAKSDIHKTLKDNIVASMSDFMVEPAGENYEFEPNETFTSVFGKRLQDVIDAPMDRGVGQKLSEIYEDLHQQGVLLRKRQKVVRQFVDYLKTMILTQIQ